MYFDLHVLGGNWAAGRCVLCNHATRGARDHPEIHDKAGATFRL